ncbi:MAG: hypothetical protein QM753_08740 [Thermomicrobiales bacterium]
MTHHLPMPESLANLKKPTRDEAANRVDFMRGQSGRPKKFEDTIIGKQIAARPDMYSATQVAGLRDEFRQKREAEVTDSLATMNRLYEEQLKTKNQIEASNQRAYDEEVSGLRKTYLHQPGATEEGFQRALPSLLEAKRTQAVLNAAGDWERQKAQFRAKHGF